MDSQPTAFPDSPAAQDEMLAGASSLSLEQQGGDALPPSEPSGPWLENPPWTGLDLFALFCVLVFSTFFFTAISVGLLRLHGKSMNDIVGNANSVWIAVPSQGAAYATIFVVLYLLARGRGLRLASALDWNWPAGFLAPVFLGAGFVLAMVAGLLQRMLPMPKELPIEKMFLQPGAPQLLAIFGVVVAPLVEETLFRGLLYPVSNRWLRHVLNDKQRVRRGRWIFLLLVPWGFAAHWHPPLGGLLLACIFLLLAGAAFAVRAAERGITAASRVILPGLTFFAWALLASRMSRVLLDWASLALLVIVLLMTIAGLKLPPGATATRIGIALSLVLTAVSFTSPHSTQLGGSWAPLLILLVVSSVLTFARAQTKSLAASVLIHVGYNATLFGGAYIATDHFRHLERLSH